MPNIEGVLKSGGTAPLDFTLHDAEHSFRVAERMADLLDDTGLANLSEFEAALLLLSAYLHDIGMTPNAELANRHWNFIATGERDLLTPEEERSLQQWLDAEE
jgi:HD superfamily phosphodiesterase